MPLWRRRYAMPVDICGARRARKRMSENGEISAAGAAPRTASSYHTRAAMFEEWHTPPPASIMPRVMRRHALFFCQAHVAPIPPPAIEAVNINRQCRHIIITIDQVTSTRPNTLFTMTGDGESSICAAWQRRAVKRQRGARVPRATIFTRTV